MNTDNTALYTYNTALNTDNTAQYTDNTALNTDNTAQYTDNTELYTDNTPLCTYNTNSLRFFCIGGEAVATIEIIFVIHRNTVGNCLPLI